jgi:hypothetical protein
VTLSIRKTTPMIAARSASSTLRTIVLLTSLPALVVSTPAHAQSSPWRLWATGLP